MTRQLFLPVGIFVAVIAALLFPAGGVLIADNNGLRILVFIIFLVSGYHTGSQGITLDRKLFVLFGFAAFISLVLAPVTGLLVSQLFSLSLPLAIGLIIISTVPPTISSGVVITEVSRGNAVLALFLTIGLNLLGIFTIPFLLNFCLHAAGPIDIDQAALLFKMLFFVLLPFAIGKLIRSLSGRNRISPIWSYVNSSCVIFMVYSSIAESQEAFKGLKVEDYALVLASVAIVHIALLLINGQTGKLLKLRSADHKALVFVTSQKTLPISLAVIANIKIDTGSAIVVCLMFHFFQLFLDSFLASMLQNK
jgi:sodium/bile acid cotransporter 7